jgi:hypothetical protein
VYPRLLRVTGFDGQAVLCTDWVFQHLKLKEEEKKKVALPPLTLGMS